MKHGKKREEGVEDGGGSYYKPNSTMTALKGEKWRGKVNRVEINEKSPNMIDVVAVIPSDVGGWTIREMGVLAKQKPLSRFAIPLTRKKSSFQAERRAKSN